MTTALEIVDTAVKIGLGALISGVSTYLLSAKSFSQSLFKAKMDAKVALVREAALKYEEAIGHLNRLSHGVLLVGIEEIDSQHARELSEFIIQAKLAINHAQSCARIAGLSVLADHFQEYSSHITDLEHIFTESNGLNIDKAADIVENFGPLWNEVQESMATAYDQIFAQA